MTFHFRRMNDVNVQSKINKQNNCYSEVRTYGSGTLSEIVQNYLKHKGKNCWRKIWKVFIRFSLNILIGCNYRIQHILRRRFKWLSKKVTIYLYINKHRTVKILVLFLFSSTYKVLTALFAITDNSSLLTSSGYVWDIRPGSTKNRDFRWLDLFRPTISGSRLCALRMCANRVPRCVNCLPQSSQKARSSLRIPSWMVLNRNL